MDKKNQSNTKKDTKKPSKDKLRKSKTLKKQNSLVKKIEIITNFEDSENKYLHRVQKRIKTLKKKIEQCKKIQEKVDKKVEVQKEEMEILNNKEKMEFTLNEYETIIFRFKEIAIEEKAEQSKRDKEKEKQEKIAERASDLRAEKLEKELKSAAKKEMEESVLKMNEEFSQQLIQKEKSTEKNTITSVLEIYFAAKFIESLNDKELMFLLTEMNVYMTSKFKHGPPAIGEIYFFSDEDLHCFRSFVMQIFPVQREIDSIKSVKDEFANSTKLINLFVLKSDDPVDGLHVLYSFQRMNLVAEAIVRSSLFYNRFNTRDADPSAAQAFMQGGAKALHGYEDVASLQQMKMADSENEKNEKGEGDLSLDVVSIEQNINFSIPQNVPVSYSSAASPVTKGNHRPQHGQSNGEDGAWAETNYLRGKQPPKKLTSQEGRLEKEGENLEEKDTADKKDDGVSAVRQSERAESKEKTSEQRFTRSQRGARRGDSTGDFSDRRSRGRRGARGYTRAADADGERGVGARGRSRGPGRGTARKVFRESTARENDHDEARENDAKQSGAQVRVGDKKNQRGRDVASGSRKAGGNNEGRGSGRGGSGARGPRRGATGAQRGGEALSKDVHQAGVSKSSMEKIQAALPKDVEGGSKPVKV